MIVLLMIFSAVVSYLVSGLNPAIILSKAVYHKDIREYGSGNPGFTNFKRTFGGWLSWLVMFLDIFKSAAVVSACGFLFYRYFDMWEFGAAFSGLFAMLGHVFPVWYKFRGGKGFLVCMTVIWLIDIRAGIISAVIMLLVLLITRYMSLADICAVVYAPVTLACQAAPGIVVFIVSVMALLMIWRHSENIERLIDGTEPKFSLRSKK